MSKRPISILESEAHKCVEFLEEFLGRSGIDKRLRQVHRELQIERGQVYREYWLLPARAFWMGLHDARNAAQLGNLEETISDRMRRPLEVAKKLMVLQEGMHEADLNSYRSRILSDDDLEPVLYEIDAAANYWQLGYDVSWMQSHVKDRCRTTEYLLSRNEQVVEVECKAKQVDSGRLIPRSLFYRLVDDLLDTLDRNQSIGKMLITLPGRLPRKPEWRREVVRVLRDSLNRGEIDTTLNDGTLVSIDIRSIENLIVPASVAMEWTKEFTTPYSHSAIITRKEQSMMVNPLVFGIRSLIDDGVLKSIFDNLIDANHQVSGKHAALICCFVPEIASFEGFGDNSGLAVMTHTFFERHAKDCVYSVVFTSSSISSSGNSILSYRSPAVSFENPKYCSEFGTDIQPLS